MGDEWLGDIMFVETDKPYASSYQMLGSAWLNLKITHCQDCKL